MGDVTLPAQWRVAVQDGAMGYPDEPSAKIPAGTYLIGFAGEADLDNACIVLKVDVAVDPWSNADQPEILQALAEVLTDSISAMDSPEPARADS